MYTVRLSALPCLLLLAGTLHRCHALFVHPSSIRPLETAVHEGLFEMVDDMYLYEGDMLLSEQQAAEVLERKMVGATYYWPRDAQGNLVIKYAWGDKIVDKAKVKRALANWEANTCARFQEIPAGSTGPHLNFVGTCCCRSWVGKQPKDGPHKVEIANNCFDGITNHEIGHAMGFHHEHNRADRDTYIKVYPQNAPENQRYNFNKEKTMDYGSPYDFYSVMHYGSMAFAKNNMAVTIRTKDPMMQQLTGEAAGLSFRDAKEFNTGYKCTADWVKKCPVSLCMGEESYVKYDEATKKCKCICRPGTSGEFCMDGTKTYEEASLAMGSPHTHKFTAPGKMTSMDYPAIHKGRTSYTQLVQAPKCKKAVVTFEKFEVDKRTGTKCDLTFVEIRLNTSLAPGKVYCATDIKPGTKFVSEGDTFILHLYSWWGYFKGYTADITFEDIPGCT